MDWTARAKEFLQHRGWLVDDEMAKDAAAFASEVERETLERGWKPIETAPKDGRHILAADFSGKGCGFGGNPRQSFQCVVHWWEWCDGTHQEEWGWYPSYGPDQALTNLTHWKPLDELASGGQGRVRE